MKDTILGEIYLALTNEELKKLSKYLSISEWRDSIKIVRCHERYKHSVKTGEELDYTKKELFEYIYPGEVYNDAKLRFTQNRLLKAIKQYVINDEFENENIFTSKIWIDFLIDRKLRKNLQYHSQEERKIENSDYRYLNEYFKSQEESHLVFQNPKNQEKQYQTIQKIIEKAQLFSDLVFIRNFCSLLTFSQTFQSVPVELPLQKLKEIREMRDMESHPEFKAYIRLIDLLVNKDEDSYYAYKETLFSSLEHFEDQEKTTLLLYLLNYTTQQINKGMKEYIDEQYDLYIKFEEKNIFMIRDNSVRHTLINNAIYLYLRKKEFSRAENVLEKYVPLLSPNLQVSCRHYNLARIYFEKKLYKDCLRELLQIDFSLDPFYSLNSKILLFKTYFELLESDALDSLFSSIKEYIKKNKVLSENYKTNAKNFFKLSKKLYDATQSELESLMTTIEKTAMIEKNWLLEKTQDRLKSKKAKS